MAGQQRRDVVRLPAPTSSATNGTSRTAAARRRSTSSPSGPPYRASRGSYPSSGGSRSPSATYGGFETTASTGPDTGSSRSPSSHSTASPRRAPLARATASAPRARLRRHHPQVGPLVGQRQRDRPRPGADVDHPRARRQPERRLHHVLGLGPRHQHARVDLQLEPPEPLAPEDVRHRLAPRAAAHVLAERLGSTPRPGSAISAARSTPSAAASSTSASRRGVSQPDAVSAISAESRASRTVVCARGTPRKYEVQHEPGRVPARAPGETISAR